MTAYQKIKEELRAAPKIWLVTGVAGFIGSNLLETLLALDQRVVGLDNFSTGKQDNLDEIRKLAGPGRWKNFERMEGDTRDAEVCKRASQGVNYILHQAALGSVPRSIQNPLETNDNNVTGFLNMLSAARENGIKRVVYASSSSVYGDVNALPQTEENLGRALSPYAVSKRVNELYADVFARCYGIEYIALRYFNVFGPRQDPNGPYAAVVPKWIEALLQNERVQINGDGETSRDFCYVANVVQANILAATTQNAGAANNIYNVAVGERTSLNQLFDMLYKRLLPTHPHLKDFKPCYADFQPGDVRHSQADIKKICRLLGYQPTHQVGQGLDAALDWYVENAKKAAPA